MLLLFLSSQSAVRKIPVAERWYLLEKTNYSLPQQKDNVISFSVNASDYSGKRALHFYKAGFDTYIK